MFRRKKPLSWFWIVVGMLVFCAIVYFVARIFLNSVSKEVNGKRLRKAMRNPAMREEMFV